MGKKPASAAKPFKGGADVGEESDDSEDDDEDSEDDDEDSEDESDSDSDDDDDKDGDDKDGDEDDDDSEDDSSSSSSSSSDEDNVLDDPDDDNGEKKRKGGPARGRRTAAEEVYPWKEPRREGWRPRGTRHAGQEPRGPRRARYSRSPLLNVNAATLALNIRSSTHLLRSILIKPESVNPFIDHTGESASGSLCTTWKLSKSSKNTGGPVTGSFTVASCVVSGIVGCLIPLSLGTLKKRN